MRDDRAQSCSWSIGAASYELGDLVLGVRYGEVLKTTDCFRMPISPDKHGFCDCIVHQEFMDWPIQMVSDESASDTVPYNFFFSVSFKLNSQQQKHPFAVDGIQSFPQNSFTSVHHQLSWSLYYKIMMKQQSQFCLVIDHFILLFITWYGYAGFMCLSIFIILNLQVTKMCLFWLFLLITSCVRLCSVLTHWI